MGYPGDLAVTVRYMLDNDNDLRIHYSAVDDQPTVLNLTNHTYFNLAGAGDGTVLDQVAMINANKITPVDSTLIPTGKMMDVAGTDLGFTTPTAIGAHIHADNQQLKYAEPKQGGYDFNYVLDNPGNLDALAASVTDPKSGRTVEMYTISPACSSTRRISSTTSMARTERSTSIGALHARGAALPGFAQSPELPVDGTEARREVQPDHHL